MFGYTAGARASSPVDKRGMTAPSAGQRSGELLDRFCSRASRSGLKPFVTLAKTMCKHRQGILAAVRMGVNNARDEKLNRRVRVIVNRAYAFHSAKAALAFVRVTLGPVTILNTAPRTARGSQWMTHIYAGSHRLVSRTGREPSLLQQAKGHDVRPPPCPAAPQGLDVHQFLV